MMSKIAIENHIYSWFVDMVELQELSHNQLKSLANWFVTSPDVDQTRKIPAIKHLREMGDVSPSTGNYNLSLHDAKFLVDNFWQSATFAELLNYRADKHDANENAELLDYSESKQFGGDMKALATHIETCNNEDEKADAETVKVLRLELRAAQSLRKKITRNQTYSVLTTALANHITDLRTRINLLRPVDTTRDLKDVLYALNRILNATGEFENNIPNLTSNLRTARNAIADELGIY